MSVATWLGTPRTVEEQAYGWHAYLDGLSLRGAVSH